MLGCVICKRTALADGVSLYRVNEYGIKGKWACGEHIHLFPEKQPDADVMTIVNAINPPEYQ